MTASRGVRLGRSRGSRCRQQGAALSREQGQGQQTLRAEHEAPAVFEQDLKGARVPRASGFCFLKKTRNGAPEGSVSSASDFGSGHGLEVCGFESHVGLCADS